MPSGRLWSKHSGRHVRAAAGAVRMTANSWRRRIISRFTTSPGAPSREFGKWNSVWKRFWRLSQRDVFEAMLALLAETSGTAHLVQMVGSTIVRAHVSAAGAKGGRRARHSAAHAVDFQPKFT